MLSKNKIKQIKSLAHKKYRDSTGLFIAEGEKIVTELIIARYRFNLIVATKGLMPSYNSVDCEKITATPDDIKKVSQLKTPPPVFALCYQKQEKLLVENLKNELTLALDQIQDPGNLGTIIRLSSWFGLHHLVCSPNTVDCYNPKVIQASMGAIAHVSIHYTSLDALIVDAKKAGIATLGTFLSGSNIYSENLPEKGIVVLGNEGQGISPEIEKLIGKKLFIPSHPLNRLSVESLNVSVAASIVCSEFRRNILV
jgi:TrmH family RNA methyltransferase